MKRILYTLLGMMLSVGAWAQTSLQDQINSATEATTIQLSGNVDLGATTLIIPADKNITIDLNGHNITSSASGAVAVKNNGTLTVKDTSGEQAGKIISTKYAGIGAGDNSVTTFESGNIESVEGAIITGKVVGATITINGGTLSASDNAVIMGNGSARDGNANTITINGGTFNGQIKSSGYVACGIYAPWKDVITVNGGTFNITGGCGVLARAGSVTINGGEFNCSGTATGKVGDSRVVVPCSAVVYDSEAGYPAMTAESKIEVPSTSTVKFTAATGVAAVSVVGESHIEISGGSYSSPLTEDVCAEGYIPSNTPNADGTYGAKEGSYVAQTGETKYASLAEAVAAVPADGTKTTIKMLADVDLTATVATVYGQNVILDLNNHNITSTVLAIKNLGDLEVTGTGSITVNGTKNTLYGISNAGAAGKKANLIIGENVTVTAPCVAILTSYGKTIVNGTLANKQADASNIYSTLYLSQTSSEVIVAESATVTGVVNAIYGAKGILEVNSTNVGKIYADGSSGITGLKVKKTSAVNSLDVVGLAEFSDNADYYVAAKAISTCTGTVKLLSDVNGTLPVNAGKTVTLDLNGHKVTAETYPIKVEGNLTITGEGTVQSTGMGSSTAVQAAAYVLKNGKLTILSGNYVAGYVGAEGNPAVYVKDNAVVEIKGGDFVGGSKFLLNKLDAYSETSTIEVTGGTFHNNFDPANNTNDVDSDSYGTNYVADGYITEMTESGSDKIYIVKEGQWIAKIEGGVDSKFRFASLDDAISAANGAGKDVTITLLADATIETIDIVADKTIDKNDHDITVNRFEVIDATASNIPFDFTANTATYTRNVAGNEWGTVCVPFTLKSTEDIKLYKFGNIEGDVLTVNEVTEATPGTPVIFANTTKAASVTFATENATVKATAPATTGTLVGTYEVQTITDGLTNIYYINGDKFHQAKASLTVPAYRAYINYYSAPSGQKPAVLSLFIGEDETTDIKTIATDVKTSTSIHDVNGRLLSAPQKGLNIVKLANGKTVKLIVK